MDLATGSSSIILTKVFNPDWGWLRKEREGGNGESKLTRLDRFYREGEKSRWAAAEGFGNQRRSLL